MDAQRTDGSPCIGLVIGLCIGLFIGLVIGLCIGLFIGLSTGLFIGLLSIASAGDGSDIGTGPLGLV